MQPTAEANLLLTAVDNVSVAFTSKLTIARVWRRYLKHGADSLGRWQVQLAPKGSLGPMLTQPDLIVSAASPLPPASA